MKYLVSEVESWGKELDAMPAPDPGRRRVGKKEAVFLLAKKLQAAARRGFSRAELLEILASKGLKVHGDTVRAALKLVGRGAVTSPVRSRRIAGAAKGLRDGNGAEADTTNGRPNAGESDGDRPGQGAAVGPELGLTLGRSAVGGSAEAETESAPASGQPNAGGLARDRAEAGAAVGPELGLALGQGGGGEVVEAEVERDTTAARWDVGGSGGDESEQGADVGPDAGPTEGREEIGGMPASRAGRGGSELGIGRGLTAESGGAELAAPNLQEVGAAPGGASVDQGRRARLRNRVARSDQDAPAGDRDFCSPTARSCVAIDSDPRSAFGRDSSSTRAAPSGRSRSPACARARRRCASARSAGATGSAAPSRPAFGIPRAATRRTCPTHSDRPRRAPRTPGREGSPTVRPNTVPDGSTREMSQTTKR
jgi:hypothetical protein